MNDFMTPEARSEYFRSQADILNKALSEIPEDQTVTIGMYIIHGTKPVEKHKATTNGR